jgi:hypothetical protein
MPKPKPRRRAVVRRRPAESTAAAGGVAGLVLALSAGDALTVVVALTGFVPAAVTFLVANGGIRGYARKLWGSPEPEPAGSE